VLWKQQLIVAELDKPPEPPGTYPIMPKISSRHGKDEIVRDQEKGHGEKGQDILHKKRPGGEMDIAPVFSGNDK
jgi:hypothetical protein